MQCPKCRYSNTQVLDTRDSVDGVRRRRECPECKHRFTTYERGEPLVVTVCKKDGRKEKFSADKIRKGVQVSCKNRPITEEQIDQLVEHIERTVSLSQEDIISSRDIGKLVEQQLRSIDHVAYLRFTSVCEEFASPSDFTQAVKSLS